MEHGEIGRVGATHFGGHQGGHPGFGLAQAIDRVHDHRPTRRDIVDLTEPHKAALRLLRERILENTRLALDLPRRLAERFRFARIPAENPRAFLGRLLSDQNMMASHRRGSWPADRVDAALEDGLVQGAAETAEILFELDELDVDTWRLIGSVLDEYYNKLSGVTPEAIRAQLWREF
jgi:hypothetical protein